MSEPKKRKRDAHDDGESRETTVFPHPVRVQVVEERDEWCPVLASSPGLAFPTDISLQAYKKKTGSGIFSDSRIVPPNYQAQPDGYELLLHSSSHPKLEFIGKEEADQVPIDDNNIKHYTGIFDPETATVQIVPSRKVAIRRMPRTEAEEMRIHGLAKQRSTLSTQRQELGLEFGSKRAKKVISANAQNAIAPTQARPTDAASSAPEKLDALGSALLSDAVAATQNQPSRAAVQAEVDEAKPRPKANLKAETPTDVYTIDGLIGADVMKALAVQEWLENAGKGNMVQTRSKYVANRLQAVATGPRKDVQKLKVLKYVEILVTFIMNLKPGQRRTKALPKLAELKDNLQTSETVVSHITQSFSDGGNVGRWHSDYLHAHICALALIVDNFQVMTGDLKHDLKLDDSGLTQYFRELGCHVRGLNEGERRNMKASRAMSAGLKVATLKLPLDFPIQRTARQGR